MMPVLFEFGVFKIYSYGLLLSIGILCVYFVLNKRAPGAGIDRTALKNVTLIALLAGIIGARVLHVLLEYGYYSRHIGEIFLINRGGLSIQGGLVAGFITSALYLKALKIDRVLYADFILPRIFLGQAIGRLGCFLNGCCYGKPLQGQTGVALAGWHFDRIPAQLISAACLFGLFLVFEYGILKRRRPRGTAAALYFLFYSVFRFFVEFTRGDHPFVMFAQWTPGQLFSAVLFCAAGAALIIIHRKEAKNNEGL